MRFQNVAAMLLVGWILVGSCPPVNAQTEPPPAPVVTQSAEQLQQLVAPIALYPDELVAAKTR